MVLTPRTAPRVADTISEVFLSATAKDMADPRTQVKEALQLVKAEVFLQEDWAEAAANAYMLSLQRLGNSDAYLGVFGYRYGWIPPGEIRSVTELECEHAIKLWGSNAPPIFLFLPEAGSSAAKLLEDAASAVLAEEYDDEPSRDDSLKKQRAFHERLRGSGLFINSFATLQALRERAMASVSNWNLEIMRKAAKGPRTVVRDIPASELGAIDRDPQREGLDAALLAVDESSEPGLCVAIHGPEDAGQFAFLSFLEQSNPWNISGKVRAITPSLDQFDVGALTSAALAEVAPLQNPTTSTIDDLAAGLVDRSETEPIVMFFPHLPRLVGGLDALYRQFWVPLTTAARARRELVAAPRKPFILVVPVMSPFRAPLPSLFQAYDADDAKFTFDFARITLLPELEPLTTADVGKWLAGVGVRVLKERKRIADAATVDGSPRAVFDRLNNDGFWPTLAR